MTTTATISGATNASWFRQIALFMACLSLMLLTLGVAHATPPPAGTPIGNQASASYTDASGISRQVTSNVVQTIVQQVASLTLTQNGSQTATPGSTVYYPHTLTNTGNGSDNFTLTAVNASGFSLTNIQIFADNGSGQPTGSAITAPIALGSNGVFKFIVVGIVPPTATTGQTNTITVTAASGFAVLSASNTDTTTVTNNATVKLTKAISTGSGAAGSGPYTYTLTYTNTGNSTATAVSISDIVPAGMNYVLTSSRWSVTGATALPEDGSTSGSAPDTIKSTYTSGSKTLTFIVNQVTAGQSGTITFNVNVASGTAPGIINNTATDSYNDGSGSTVTGSSNTVPFTVAQAAGVTLTGSTVALATPGALVSFTNTVKNTGNATDTFDITFGSNNFPAGTSFTLFKSDGVTPLVNTNSNSAPDTGPLAAGASYNVIVIAQLPANASGGAFTLNKTATSTIDPSVKASTTDTLTAVTGASVDLTNTSVFNLVTPAPGQGPGPEVAAIVSLAKNPGQTATFSIFINNTGPVSDSYALGASTVSNFSSLTLPAGWSVVFKADGGSGDCSTTGATIPSPTPSVPAGGNLLVCAVATLPSTGAGALAGTSNLYFRAFSSASGAQDTIHDAVTVNPVRTISYTPNNNNQTYPGGTVVYSNTLTNTGNVLEGNGTVSTIVLTAADSKAGWTSVQYYDVTGNGLDATDPIVPAAGLQAIPALAGGLAPGASIIILDKVTAPSGAQLGDVDVSTVTATTSNGSYSSAVPAPAIATNGTTVIAGNLQLGKLQALDNGCAGATGSTTYIGTTVSALPGKCVLYQITVKNVGSANADSVVVSDATPTFTLLKFAAATTVGSVTDPGVGSSGTITATIGTLTPGQSAVVTFGVQIQQ